MAYRGNSFLRTLDRLLRPRLVDLVDVLSGVGQHDHLIAPDIHEPTVDDVVVLLTANAVAQLTRLQGGHHGRMVREHAQLALATWRNHHLNVALEQDALGCDDF